MPLGISDKTTMEITLVRLGWKQKYEWVFSYLFPYEYFQSPPPRQEGGGLSEIIGGDTRSKIFQKSKAKTGAILRKSLEITIFRILHFWSQILGESILPQ